MLYKQYHGLHTIFWSCCGCGRHAHESNGPAPLQQSDEGSYLLYGAEGHGLILQLGDLAKHVLRVRDPGSVKDAYYALLGMAALNGSGKLPKPALLSIMSHEVPMKKGMQRAFASHFSGMCLLEYLISLST